MGCFASVHQKGALKSLKQQRPHPPPDFVEKCECVLGVVIDVTFKAYVAGSAEEIVKHLVAKHASFIEFLGYLELAYEGYEIIHLSYECVSSDE